jgi:hypothetical protein
MDRFAHKDLRPAIYFDILGITPEGLAATSRDEYQMAVGIDRNASQGRIAR